MNEYSILQEENEQLRKQLNLVWTFIGNMIMFDIQLQKDKESAQQEICGLQDILRNKDIQIEQLLQELEDSYSENMYSCVFLHFTLQKAL